MLQQLSWLVNAIPFFFCRHLVIHGLAADPIHLARSQPRQNHTLLCLIFFPLAAFADLTAQQNLTITNGMRVRLWAPELGIRKQVGAVAAINADTLMLKVADRKAPLIVPVNSVTRLDVSLGRQSHTGRGAVIGLAVGVAAGLGASIAFTNAGDFDLDKVALIFVPVSAATGTGIGALTGLASRSDRWQSVPLPIRIGISEHNNGG